MACSICGNKPMNCDCTETERRQFYEIEELEARVPRWVRVAERLPEKGLRVIFLVDRKSTGFRAAYVGEYVAHSAFQSWACYEDERGWDASFVTHWMPLPELPEETTP